MAILAVAVDASEVNLDVSSPGTPRIGARYRIDDELVELIGYWRGTYTDTTPSIYAWDPDETAWVVSRGAEGTEAASHSQGATVTEFVPTAGGGLPTGWTQDEVDPANVSTSGGGLDLGSGGAATPAPALLSNLEVDTGGGDIATQGGSLDLGFGTIDQAGTITGDTTGSTLEEFYAGHFGEGGVSIDGDLDHDGTAVGFYGTVPVARPQVPASPTVQDVVDALVALGLVTQAV